ncbi:MAG: DEAD/DEAH box helicase [Proteobacteria bacterium]|nr:DEAD/DEAH box helicase [Pseudomonadota bacterium]
MMTLKLHRTASLEEKTKSFDYQRETIESIKNLEYSAIFLEQGLGKTKVAIDLCLFWLRRGDIDTAIIVTKKGLVKNWEEEFLLHSHIKPRILNTNRTSNHAAMLSPSRLYITNFETIKLEEKKFKVFCKLRCVCIILDESQKIKNPESKLTESFLRISGLFKKRVIMTGTPIANRPYDIWAQIRFLDGGSALGNNFSKFKKTFNLPNSNDKDSFIDALEKIFPAISKFTVRLTKSNSGIQLPSKHYYQSEAEWETLQKKMYETIKRELSLEVLKNGVLINDNSESILKRILRLVQITSNPSLIDERYINTPGKLPVLLDILKNTVKPDEKAIVWTSFVENANQLCANLADYGAVKLHGKLNMVQRHKAVTRFKKENNVRVLVATPAAAKEGLTLTVANHVIYYDRGFSLDDYLQSQDRIHRISQNRTCFVHNIVLPNSIDQWVGVLLEYKEKAAAFSMGDSLIDELETVIDYDLSEILRNILNME